jgi:hypothetical protein
MILDLAPEQAGTGSAEKGKEEYVEQRKCVQGQRHRDKKRISPDKS